MLYLLLVVFLIYFGWLLFLWRGLRFVAPRTEQVADFASVVVAARNEAVRLPALLRALQNQTLPKEKFEILVVDDRSTDATPDILSEWQQKLPNLRMVRVVNVPPEMPPKKNALIQGIANSRAPLLFFTDADCEPSSNWLEGARSFFTPETDAVVGFTHIRPAGKRLLPRFLEIESVFNSTVARAGLAAGIPLTATAANLAYRRRVYEAVGGFRKIAHSVSGDDDLFLQVLKRELDATIRFATDPAVRVETDAPATWRDFFRQRLRHLSAGKYYTPKAKTVYGLFHFSQTLLLLIPAGFFWIREIGLLAFFFLLKLVLDIWLFRTIRKTYAVRFSIPLALLWEYFYLVETWLIGPLSWIFPVSWKEPSQAVGENAH